MTEEGDGALGEGGDADVLRATEHRRLRALVEGDHDVAEQLHADDFQLINPSGGLLSKEQYLGGIASGEVNYLAFEPDSPITVRVHGQVGLIRYRSRLAIVVRGTRIPLRHYWHTDTYEQRGGRWQVVWSHATEIQEP